LPLGTVIVINQAVGCPPGAPIGGKCLEVEVACPNTANLDAYVVVTNPAGTSIGTIVLHGGGGGTSVFNGASPGGNFSTTYLTDHYTVVQIAWLSGWEFAGPGFQGSMLNAACRPATLLAWIYNHIDDHTKGYCVQGYSAGASAAGYSVAQYGLKNEIDALMFAGGPPLDDLYRGCVDPSSSLITVCPGVTGHYTYNTSGTSWGSAQLTDQIEGTSSCENQPASQDVAIWTADSLDNSVGDFSYPQTLISAFMCPALNLAPGQGMFFLNAAAPSVDNIQCGTTSNGCSGEKYWYNSPLHFNQMVDQMRADCVLRH
jgi:hypothetical protein